MTESELRQKAISIIRGWIGYSESNNKFKEIIDIYNKQKKLPRGYRVKYTDEWCATTVSACAIEAGLTDIIPCECSCNEQVKLFQKLGTWKENDNYIPNIADIIYYDWEDNGVGDNTGVPNHVGIVEKISGQTITVIEGNKNEIVARRNIIVGGKYIRGYGVPNYKSKATKTTTKKATQNVSIDVGSTVEFVGKYQYTSSYSDGKKVSAVPCKAKISNIKIGRVHEYHLIGNGVYGWVNKSDIKELKNSNTFKVGDVVIFTGNKHYTNSYDGATCYSCDSGEAKIMAINKNGKYIYNIKHTSKGNVDGWVESKYVNSK